MVMPTSQTPEEYKLQKEITNSGQPTLWTRVQVAKLVSPKSTHQPTDRDAKNAFAVATTMYLWAMSFQCVVDHVAEIHKCRFHGSVAMRQRAIPTARGSP